MKELKFSFAVLISSFLGAIALYWSTLSGGPLVDDFRLLEAAKNGRLLDNFSATPPGVAGVFWRPAVSILLKVEWLLFHLHFAGYRATSALLCAITALCIYAVLFKLTRSRSAGLVAAAFFILWPSHPETMVWIAGQTDGLATCFAWLALWGFVVYWTDPTPKWSRVPVWLLPLVLAMVAKESAIVMPGLIFLIALAVRPKALQEHKWHVAFLAANATFLTAGYLWLRSQMIHQPMLGGGYVGGSKRGLLTGVYNGFMTYHLNLNLLNAYAPLSSRVSERVGWTSDAFVLILVTFGVAAVLRHLARGPDSSKPRIWLALATLLFAILATLELAGSYPVALLTSLAEIPMGLLAISIVVATIATILYRERRPLMAGWNRACDAASTKTVLTVGATMIAAFVVFRNVQGTSAHPMPFAFLFSYWALIFVTRPTESEGAPHSPTSLPRASLIMAAASVVALVPVMTIRQVDANLANARFAYLASSFAVPALVAAIWSVVAQKRTRQILSASIAVLLIVAVSPVIQIWSHSVRLSTAFEDAIQHSTCPRVYVLSSPGFIPSATTVILGGDALDASGRLFRDDALPVFPGYYADGFTEGDHLQVDPLGNSTWRIKASFGPGRDRSGSLTLLPCYADFRTSPSYQKIPGIASPRQLDVHLADPIGEVLAVNEGGLTILRSK